MRLTPGNVENVGAAAGLAPPPPPMAWPDHLRAFATCAVILLHSAFQGVRPPVSSFGFGVNNGFDSATRACVPLFVMLTGALLLPQEQPLGEYLRKRFGRILWPFLFWSAVYLAYGYYSARQEDRAVGPLAALQWAYGKLQVRAEYHLWYVYMVVGLYLFLPVAGRWVRSATEKELLYFLGLWFVTLVGGYPFLAQYGIGIDLGYFSGYLGYAVLGYYIATRPPRGPAVSRSWLAVGLVLVGFGVTAGATLLSTLRKGHFVETYYGFLTPNVCLMAMGIFYLFRHRAAKPLAGFPRFIARNSYNIYLAHVLVLMVFARAGIHGFVANPLLGVPAVAAACLACTALLVWGLNTTPLGKHLKG